MDGRDHSKRTAVGILFAAPVVVGALAWLRPPTSPAYILSLIPSYNDHYRLVWPNIVHATRSLRTGAGLLWNPYQACGEPAFANIQTAILYPLTPLLALHRDHGLVAFMLAHLALGGLGTFLLARAIGTGVVAALCGGLAFEFTATSVRLGAWGTMLMGPYAWLPVAMWRTERLVQAPEARNAAWLALVLTLQLLAGFPQTLFFTYQLIALRVGWALVVREGVPPRRLVVMTIVAALLPLGLGAVQLLPSMEMARESVRQIPLDPRSIGPGFSWSSLAMLAWVQVLAPVDKVLAVLAGSALFGLWRPEARTHVAFWALLAFVYLVLSLGPGTPLWAVYEHLPLGATFRDSQRLVWVTSFALAVLVALGTEAIWQRLPGPLRWLPPLAVLACALVFRPSPIAAVRDGDLYGAHAEAWRFVRDRITSLDRVAILGGPLPDFALMPKSATLFAVPAIYDYEPIGTFRYANFFTWMRTGHGLRHLRDWYWVADDLLPPTLQRTLFDLTAARFIMVDPARDHTSAVLGTSARLLGEPGGLRVYENERAVPRVRWVPMAAVQGDDSTLSTLAREEHDPRRLVLLDRAPASGFLGADASADAGVEVITNVPERLAVRVRAPVRGFLVVADQWFPGWQATVNGHPADVQRADYVFRAVEVPAGESEVVFVYRPNSLRVGALVSLLTAGGLIVAMWRTKAASRRRSPSSRSGPSAGTSTRAPSISAATR